MKVSPSHHVLSACYPHSFLVFCLWHFHRTEIQAQRATTAASATPPCEMRKNKLSYREVEYSTPELWNRKETLSIPPNRAVDEGYEKTELRLRLTYPRSIIHLSYEKWWRRFRQVDWSTTSNTRELWDYPSRWWCRWWSSIPSPEFPLRKGQGWNLKKKKMENEGKFPLKAPIPSSKASPERLWLFHLNISFIFSLLFTRIFRQPLLCPRSPLWLSFLISKFFQAEAFVLPGQQQRRKPLFWSRERERERGQRKV